MFCSILSLESISYAKYLRCLDRRNFLGTSARDGLRLTFFCFLGGFGHKERMAPLIGLRLNLNSCNYERDVNDVRSQQAFCV